MITKLPPRLFVMSILLLMFGSLTVALAAPTHQDEPATRQPTATALPPTPTPTATSPADAVCYETYTMESGDTLSSVAQQFYGEARVFELIVDATNQAAELDDRYLVITDTDNLDMGQNLCITDTVDIPVIDRTEAITLLASLTQTTTSTVAATPTMQPTPSFDIPVGQAALTFENLSPTDLVVDIIGPTNDTRQIPPSTVEIFFLEPGDYHFNAHSPNGVIRLPAGIWTVGVGDVAEVIAFANIFQLDVIEAGSRVTPTSQPTAPLTIAGIITNATIITEPILTPTSQLTSTTVSATATPQPTATASTPTLAQPTPTPQPTSTTPPTATIPPTSTIQPTATRQPTSTIQPTATRQPTSTIQPTATRQPTSTTTPTTTRQPTSTATPQPTATTTATIPPTTTRQPTSTTTPTATPQPTTSPTPTTVATRDPRLAPPPGQARAYLQNLFSDEAVFNINNQTVIVDTGELETLDLDPGVYPFTVGIPGGTGKGELSLDADQSWLIRVDENGGLGWAQVY